MQEERFGDGDILEYALIGEGKPVVLLHGFGEDAHIWDAQVDFLKDHCRLIVPQLPGTGRSSLLRENAGVGRETAGVSRESEKKAHASRLTSHDITIDDYADRIHALLQALDINSCIMIGHSMGGYITLAFAEKYPDKLQAMGLVHSTAFADSEEKKQMRQKAIDTIGKYGAAAFLKTTIPNLFGRSFKEKHPEKIGELIRSGEQFSEATLQQYYRAMMLRPDRTPVLKSNDLPVLFVMGTEDNAAPMDDVLQQVSVPAKSYIYILEDVGHMGMWEATAELNRILLAFIQQ
jgi:pimeloyl-ACP methyl ester carboxylesterase